jgi:CBS domain-containing protein
MVNTIIANGLLVKEYQTIGENSRIAEALARFDDSTNVLMVINEEGAYQGILQERKLLRSSLNPEEAKVKHFMAVAPKITSDTSASECAKLMLESNTRCLPVMQGGKLLGVVTDSILLQSIAGTSIGNKKVSEYMSIAPVTISPKEPVAIVLNKFREFHISRLPVIEDGKIVGISTLHELIKKVIQRKKLPARGFMLGELNTILDWSVDTIMSKTPVLVSHHASISTAIHEMVTNNAGGLMVAEERQALKGVLTRKDLLELVAENFLDEEYVINIDTNRKEVDRVSLKEIILHFIKKYPVKLRNSSFHLYIRTHKEQMKGIPLIYARCRVRTKAGWFMAREEGWGMENAVKHCLLKIERQMMKKFELLDDDRRKKFLNYVDFGSL